MIYKDLGYQEYNDYLEGEEWQEIKNYFYEHCGSYECRGCHVKQGLVLHKRSYRFLTLSAIKKRYIFPFWVKWYLKKYMVWLCHDCNKLVHFYSDGRRVDLDYKSLMKREKYVFSWKYKLDSFFGKPK